MPCCYRQLDLDERRWSPKYPVTVIARAMGQHRSIIHREMGHNHFRARCEYQTMTVCEVIAAEGQPLPVHAGFKAGMAFSEPAIERFFAELADAIAEHEARGWEDSAVREHRRAIEAYRDMLAGA